MNSIELIRIGTKILQKNLKFNAELDSELILSNILKTSREKLIIHPKKNINKTLENKFKSDIKERKLKKPIAYILGYKEFWKQKFITDCSVLIPRPDTELIIEKVLKNFKKSENKKVLDIGTGSGCIILSILLERKKFRGIGIDISKQAINIAKINAKMQQFGNRIKFINTDIDNFFSYKYDLIVSNPPYIKKSKIISLEEDVKRYEPLLAIDGGHNGYEMFKKVISRSSKWLKKKGKLILEIDKDQTRVLKNMLLKYKFYKIQVIKDLSNNERCIIAEK